jgi:hypothetical protein
VSIERSMATPRSLLERYVQAKDCVQPHLMSEIYTPDAVLTYSIATDTIAFPARTNGLDAITKTLVVDFATRFERCKTYYVCDAPLADESRFARIPWLVIMRETAAASLRIGKGYYEWTFVQPARVRAMHIHIARMDAIADEQASLLTEAQAQLPYPWLAPAKLASIYEERANRSTALAFLRDFKTPLIVSLS